MLSGFDAKNKLYPFKLKTLLLSVRTPVKKNGQIRCCVDFLDLYQACPKDDFPLLPNMDLLIDATAGHEMFSFMDGYSGYNQIKMNPVDATCLQNSDR